jgi:hypothetical protein
VYAPNTFRQTKSLLHTCHHVLRICQNTRGLYAFLTSPISRVLPDYDDVAQVTRNFVALGSSLACVCLSRKLSRSLVDTTKCRCVFPQAVCQGLSASREAVLQTSLWSDSVLFPIDFREFLFIVPSVLSEDAQTLKTCAVSGQDDPNGFLEYFEFISLVFGNQVRKCSRST